MGGEGRTLLGEWIDIIVIPSPLIIPITISSTILKLWPGHIVPVKQIEYGVYGDLIIVYPKPYWIY